MLIDTKRLQGIMARVVKGASCNRLLPMTSLVEIHGEKNWVHFTTTDGNNWVQVELPAMLEYFHAVVDATALNSIIQKLTTEQTELSCDDVTLTIKADGNYKLPMSVDERGEIIKFNDTWNFTLPNMVITTTITTENVSKIIKSNSKSLSISLAEPCFSGYYFGGKVLTSDSFTICCNDFVCKTEPVLLYANTVNLLSICEETIQMFVVNDKVKFISGNTTIVANCMEGIENFQAEKILSIVETSYPRSVVVKRNKLVAMLERINLFVNPFDKNTVSMKFEGTKLILESLRNTGKETLECETVYGDTFECNVDIKTLLTQVGSQTGDTITIEYGNSTSIKITDDGHTVIVIALSAD